MGDGSVIPACQGDERFDDGVQADYVAQQLTAEFGTQWRRFGCGDHFHVWEASPQVLEAERLEELQHDLIMGGGERSE